MRRINTPLTRLLDITTPVVVPPMAGASGGALAAQATIGGGFGFIASGYGSLESLGNEIALARSLLDEAQHPRPEPRVLPIGVGFFGWLLEKDHARAKEYISFVLDNNLQAIWFSFGRDLGTWVQFVRDYDQRSSKSHRTVIFVLVNTVEEASAAISIWKADVVVAQGKSFLHIKEWAGNEAGGHGLGTAPSLLTLVPAVLDLSDSEMGCPPILAAGGLATGAHIASMLTLGTSGAVLGTRFLLSPESQYSDEQRRCLIDAGPSSTVRTMAFDNARGTLDWPEGIDGRGLRNDTVKDFDAGMDLKNLQELFQKGIAAKDPSRMLVWAGTGVGIMKSVKPATHIVQELHTECEEKLRRVYNMCE
ncbi:hypothetical protein VNI00_002730 [Paramarasmius palmivorus]|uniref:2-nitropropane dioxygenase n=1 Tax=Paramarasmius palmivorus TaxID=297713 RepID=A0AAW0DZ37_9AGAR